jgi:hypothetical protein
MNRLRTYAIALLFVFGLFFSPGCGPQSNNGRPKPVPVKGLVLVDDEPSEGTRVVFVPQGHNYAAAGKTDASGRFTLQTFDAGDGAVPGDYKIIVSNFEVIENPNGTVTETHFLPENYRNPETSGLTAVVSETSPNEVTLILTVPSTGIKQPKLPAD